MSKILDYPNLSPAARAAIQSGVNAAASTEVAHAAETWRQQRAADEKRLADLEKQHERLRAERDEQRRSEQKKNRETESKKLDAQIRQKFFEANPFATELDFSRVADDLRSEHLLERMKSRENSEKLIRATSVGRM